MDNQLSDIEKILELTQSHGAAATSSLDPTARPMYGSTIFIARCEITLRYGVFTACIFQDLIHKGYIVALVHGDVKNADQIYTRIHSSCVTSETLRGCDCDCIKQLEGALERIASKKAGIFFYLIQEGRGVGYVAKARDRMLVQASHDRLSTFEAYKAMGLKKDYRNYGSIAAIIHLLGVTAPFVVLTNNPDKLAALTELGVKVAGHERIEYEPGAFNLAYLASKAESGHFLEKSTSKLSLRSAVPPEPVVPFNPYALKEAQRFIYAASYYLPMKPVDGEILVSRADYEDFTKSHSLKKYMNTTTGLLGRFIPKGNALITSVKDLGRDKVLITVDRKKLGTFKKSNPSHELVHLLTTPYWFRVHVYFDIVSGQDFVVLIHGNPSSGAVPVVRIQSESIFDRFPLTDVSNRDKLKASAKMIVHNGFGMMILLYNDGRGAGFGAHATDRMFREYGITGSSDETYKMLGIDYDLRDYDAAMRLVKHHIPDGAVQMIMNSPESLVKKHEHAVAISNSGIQVRKWLFLEEESHG